MPKERIYSTDQSGLMVEVTWRADAGHVQLGTVHPDSPVKWPEGDSPSGTFDGWFVQLGREDVNRLIRKLRRARDATWGADA